MNSGCAWKRKYSNVIIPLQKLPGRRLRLIDFRVWILIPDTTVCFLFLPRSQHLKHWWQITCHASLNSSTLVFRCFVFFVVVDKMQARYSKQGFICLFLSESIWNAASFYQESSYLYFPTLQAELASDISFYFKTSAPSGVFLENLGLKDFIRVELSCE